MILALEPSGAYSWQHLTFVGSLIALMIFLAIFLGLRNRHKDVKEKNKVLIWAAILIDSIEIAKIVIFCIQAGSLAPLRTNMPLFLCSIQLIVIPLAAFTKGRLKEVSSDFVSIFGILGAILGTVGAAQNYNAYPVISVVNIASGLTHSIAGFASLYIMISGMASMKKENIIFTCLIMTIFCLLALGVNYLVDYNYMFLRSHDGTPYVIFYNMVGGNPVLYPMVVILVFYLYIGAFYLVWLLIKRKKNNK